MDARTQANGRLRNVRRLWQCCALPTVLALASVVLVTNSAGSATGNSATLSVGDPTVAAQSITTQPVGLAVIAGQTLTITLVAAGRAPLSYLNGAAISRATRRRRQPTITTQPVNQTVTAGQTATFTVVAAGTAPLGYQWQKNGVNIAGATASSYTTPVTTTANSGSTFDVVVSNTAGSVTSSAATLTVTAAVVAPTITTQPVNQTVTAGQTATFTVVAAGTAPLSYQWQKNGVNIAGATASSYTTPVTTTANSG